MKAIPGTVLVLLAASLLGASPRMHGLSTDRNAAKGNPAGIPAAANLVEPQVVRVSFVQGDVRVSRGKEAEKVTHEEWGKAEVNLPIESGFSLVTGDGRAEVEFEDASVVYLAENSVLLFNELTTTGGVPNTEMSLLSGSMTLNVQPMLGEWFSVRTPTDRFAVIYPEKSFLRVDSYMDATSLTGLRPMVFHLDRAAALHAQPNQTVSFRQGEKVYLDKAPAAGTFAEWDGWVSARVAERERALAEVMNESGLKTPIPGMAEMAQQGKFFPCEPYGTCWEPNGGWAGSPLQAQAAQVNAMPATPAGQQTIPIGALQGQPQVPRTSRQAAYVPGTLTDEFEEFPCSPVRWHSWYGTDPVTGKRVLVQRGLDPQFPLNSTLTGPRYEWAVCHAGSWVHRERRYVWVAGTRRHHHCPVHWVRTGRTVGYVPVHPRDGVGKPPGNLQYGIFHPVGRKDEGVEKLAFDAARPVKVLDEAPKEFRREQYTALARVDAPRAEGHSFRDAARAGGELQGKSQGMPILFDHKSQSFVVARQVSAGGSTRVVAEPIGGRGGSLQTHAPNSAETAHGGGSGGGSYSSAVRGNYGGTSSSASASGRSTSGASSAGTPSHASSAPAPSAPSAPAPSSSAGGASAPASTGSGKSH